MTQIVVEGMTMIVFVIMMGDVRENLKTMEIALGIASLEERTIIVMG